MGSNSFGKMVTMTTFGESHGTGIGVIVDGLEAGIPIDPVKIQSELDRRRPGQSSVTTPRKEPDEIEVLSGLFEGKSTGTPIAMFIRNTNQHSGDYQEIARIYRPGHADRSYDLKYGIRDYRGGGRSSGRETAARVAAGAVAKQALEHLGMEISAYTLEAAGVRCKDIDLSVIEKNSMRAPDLCAAEEMLERIKVAVSEQDSCGGIVECQCTNIPAGLGDPIFSKLDANLAAAVMSLGSVKGIEFGDGFAAAAMRGSEHNDQFLEGSWTNHAGGVLGGISNGLPIVFRCAVKPTPSISRVQKTLDVDGSAVTVNVKGRHDPCICPRIVPVIEAMTALTLLDAYYMQFGHILS